MKMNDQTKCNEFLADPWIGQAFDDIRIQERPELQLFYNEYPKY
jgi:hypothetical protein